MPQQDSSRKTDTGVEAVISRWLASPRRRQFTSHQQLDPVGARTRPLPAWVEPALARALAERGMTQLYEHQWRAVEATRRGLDVVVATPTSSGKTLCYNLPVLQELLVDPRARALYLFPTKALARDQVAAARELGDATGKPIGVAVYDGDTPPDQRRAARRKARILATNPDMLHTGILPHHPAWAEFFAGLRYVVIDELHVYRGVFGSHLAHVLQRLQRLARFHGAEPRFICSSATIANPTELAERLIGRPVELVADSGAPQGERHFLIYNPPLIDAALGIRESYLKASCTLTHDLLQSGISTLVFCRTRLAVEVLLRHLRDRLDGLREPDAPAIGPSVRGYRGGYLPARRRTVEAALRQGEASAVVATSALELGIDIGALDAVVVAGWPGSRAATWQRAGRAGRRLAPSLCVMVASSEPLDQYVAADPAYLFEQAPEHARIDPNNPSILVPHIKCAAYELPFVHGEAYGAMGAEETDDVLGALADASLLHRTQRGYHHVDDVFPAADVSLRGPADENFLVVLERSGEDGRIIAEVNYEDAPQELHRHAIYQLEGRQYEVLRLDHDNHKAYVAAADVDYYTDALTQTRVRVLSAEASPGSAAGCARHGEVHIVHRVVGFKKIKLHTNENIGYGDVEEPDREMHTTSLWMTVSPARLGLVDRTPAEIAEAALGASRALHSAAALLLMSDSRDIGRAVGDARSGWFPVAGSKSRGMYGVADDGCDTVLAPTIFLFDRYPGGTGLSERLYQERGELLARTRRIVERCACERGCPACIGPGATVAAKDLAARLLELIAADLFVAAPDAPAPCELAPSLR